MNNTDINNNQIKFIESYWELCKAQNKSIDEFKKLLTNFISTNDVSQENIDKFFIMNDAKVKLAEIDNEINECTKKLERLNTEKEKLNSILTRSSKTKNVVSDPCRRTYSSNVNVRGGC